VTNASVTFGLEIDSYDSVAEADAGKEIVLPTPQLEVFFSASIAAANKEGLNIVEGDLWFFAFDGSPLKACFSKEPYVDTDRRKYFPGVYSLQPGFGEKLQEVIAKLIAKNPSPHTQIIVRVPATNESAQRYGWSDIKAMKDGIGHALKILPSDMAKRIVFELPWITARYV
jgi:hypothetical protein